MSTYEDRAEQLGFAPKDEIKSLSHSEEVVFLDVRGESEIEAEPLGGDFKIVYCPCSRTDATELVNKSSEILPDKSAPIVIFCRSGARAKTGKEALEAIGYTKIYNAGGVCDMDYLL
ncbi:hypothetical protein CTEN210_13144 [Chaetoceros tenuissimus]|uniref:Rhodanese domain-containing protein n=1 Tax=Chaetoceros tenuissimus TaxID=426638 RepID=A0AAD3D2V1_9STRA|nr:hypothetical protein CTEN210_13144 [Chaetoceros tenuissimus]